MTTDWAITAENLGKTYLIRHQTGRSYVALRDVLAERTRRVGQRVIHPRGGASATHADPSREQFWALQDVSFTIQPGERVGIIGRNGAGKSTLLKILSRITDPSAGRLGIRGRVASLLEVGTGFHPELTGRENIYLNGAVLGMPRVDIKRKFDEIVAFAEVEQFLDTPVKRYSSGMYVRLAFAVAAHLEPEILIVDEVLAVGDASFQKKCLGKMEEVGGEGRTVLFVSHNMNAIERLCSEVFTLEKGRLADHSRDVRSGVRRYLTSEEDSHPSTAWINNGTEYDNPWFRPCRFFLSDRHGWPVNTPVPNDSAVWVNLQGEVRELDPALTIGCAIHSEDGTLLYWSYQTDSPEVQWPQLRLGVQTLRARLPERLLNEGSFRIELVGGLHNRVWLFEPGSQTPAIHLNIQGGLSDSPMWISKRPGLLAPILRWEISVEE